MEGNPIALRLHRLRIPVTPVTEEILLALLERLSGTQPVIWTDQRTGNSTASLFLDDATAARACAAATRSAWRQLRAEGIVQTRLTIHQDTVRKEDWAESWKRHFPALRIGTRLLILPTWSRRRPRPGQKAVRLDPGLSFGTGHHATTSYCLAELDRLANAGVQGRFTDVGTGSGILAIAAAKLGFDPVVALDNDPVAVRIAHTNAARNRVAHHIRLRTADLAALRINPRSRSSVVCANLTADLLVTYAGRLAQLVEPGGHLLLAGILRRQFAEVDRAFQRAGLNRLRKKTEKEWTSGTFQRPTR